jgi:hypothetical protein
MPLKLWHGLILVVVLAASAVNWIIAVREHHDLGYVKPNHSDFYSPYYVQRNLRTHSRIDRRGVQREILIVGFGFIAWFSGWFTATQKAKAQPRPV